MVAIGPGELIVRIPLKCQEHGVYKEEMKIKKLCVGSFLSQKWELYCTKPFCWTFTPIKFKLTSHRFYLICIN